MAEQTVPPGTTPTNENGSERQRSSNNTNRSSQRGNQRNNNLAVSASDARSFKGKISSLPVIGKHYENTGVSFKIFQKDVADYVALELNYGDDFGDLVQNLKDTIEDAIGTEPIWKIDDKDNYGKQ